MAAATLPTHRPGKGDVTRTLPPFGKSRHFSTNSSYFAQVNTGKQSIALDLKADEDRAVFERLLAASVKGYDLSCTTKSPYSTYSCTRGKNFEY